MMKKKLLLSLLNLVATTNILKAPGDDGVAPAYHGYALSGSSSSSASVDSQAPYLSSFLPYELIELILQFIEKHKDKCQFASTCKQFYLVFSDKAVFIPCKLNEHTNFPCRRHWFNGQISDDVKATVLSFRSSNPNKQLGLLGSAMDLNAKHLVLGTTRGYVLFCEKNTIDSDNFARILFLEEKLDSRIVHLRLIPNTDFLIAISSTGWLSLWNICSKNILQQVALIVAPEVIANPLDCWSIDTSPSGKSICVLTTQGEKGTASFVFKINIFAVQYESDHFCVQKRQSIPVAEVDAGSITFLNNCLVKFVGLKKEASNKYIMTFHCPSSLEEIEQQAIEAHEAKLACLGKIQSGNRVCCR